MQRNNKLRPETEAKELARSNKELSEFAQIVSHDLRGPLQGVLLYCQALERRCGHKLDDEDLLHLEYITETTKGMVALTESLLSYALVSSIDRHMLVATDTAAVLRLAMSNLSSDIAASSASVICEGLPIVLAGPNHVLQLFQNLIANGIKYCRQGKPHIWISAGRKGDYWLFSVRDNGIGIDSKHFDRIFEPFKRLHGGDIPGSGLGLSICKKIVDEEGGRIWVESEVGGGSTFLFTLPVNREL